MISGWKAIIFHLLRNPHEARRQCSGSMVPKSCDTGLQSLLEPSFASDTCLLCGFQIDLLLTIENKHSTAKGPVLWGPGRIKGDDRNITQWSEKHWVLLILEAGGIDVCKAAVEVYTKWTTGKRMKPGRQKEVGQGLWVRGPLNMFRITLLRGDFRMMTE